MKVHIVCIDQPGMILRRKAEVLAEHTGWTLGTKPDPTADLNYAIPYLTGRHWTGAPLASYFTHREDVLSGKVRIWEEQAARVILRVTSAQQYTDDLSHYGPTVRILPPLDREMFTPGERKQRARPVAGVSGFTIGGGRKGELLIADVLRHPAAGLYDWTGAGKGWPLPTQMYPWGELPNWYRSLDVYVCPSIIEGVPYGPLEALACGVPIVIPRGVGLLDDLPSIPGILRYDAGDAVSLALALEAFHDVTFDRDALRTSTTPYTAGAWAQGHIEAFDRLVNPAPVHSDRGVYVVAYGENARTCAYRLLASIRRYLPGVPVAVCSDRPLLGADHWIPGDDGLRGRIAKTKIYDWAPAVWQYVLYLDADTEIMQHASDIWHPLETGSELLLNDGSPRNQVRHNLRPTNREEYAETVAFVGAETARGVCGGVFAFRRSANAEAFFQRWHREYMRWQGKHDQPSMVRARYGTPEARVHWLGPEWNRFTKHERPGDEVIIRHWSGGPARITGDGIGIGPGGRVSRRLRKIYRSRETTRNGGPSMPQFRHTTTGGVQSAREGSHLFQRFTNSPNWELIDDTPPASTSEPQSPSTEEPTYPRHVGGGYYDTPNGERHKGKPAAIAAMSEQG